MSEFLENLKKAVDIGEFNSDAAKKINELNKLADLKTNSETNLNNRLNKAGIKTVTEEEATTINLEHEKKMNEIKKQDICNKQIATLIEIEDMIKMSIDDMFSFIKELENKFLKESNDKDSIYVNLFQKIQEIKIKYNNINNN